MKKSFFIVGVVVLAAVVAFIKFFNLSKSNEVAPAPKAADTPTVTPSSNNTVTVTPTGDEKSLSAKTHYNNPAGGDDVAFTVVVDKNGVITDAKTQVLAIHGISEARQKSFADSLPAVVVGKKLADLTSLDRVGGSSLTTNAFNSVLPDLKAKL